MSSRLLLEKLAEIRDSRLLGTQASEALAPLIDKPIKLSLSFVSAGRTFGQSYNKAYEGGQTLVCKLGGEEKIEATVLIVPEEDDLVQSLEPEEVFEARLAVLDFDTLYQRPVLGQFLGEVTTNQEEEEEEEEIESEPEEAEDVLEEDDEEDLPEEDEVLEQQLELDIAQAKEPGPAPAPQKPVPPPDALKQAARRKQQKSKQPQHGRSLKQKNRQRKIQAKGNKQKQAGQQQQEGCQHGCRFLSGAGLILLSLISCSNNAVQVGFFFLVGGAICFWPLIKKQIDEQSKS